MNVELNVFKDTLDHIPLHAELWNTACNADFQKTLDDIGQRDKGVLHSSTNVSDRALAWNTLPTTTQQ